MSEAKLEDLRDWCTKVLLVVGNAHRSGGPDLSTMNALVLLRKEAIIKGFPDEPRARWDDIPYPYSKKCGESKP
jgi:hypothetical protein